MGSLLVVLIWGVRILAYQARGTLRPCDEFADVDCIQTVFITIGAGIVFLIAFVILLSE